MLFNSFVFIFLFLPATYLLWIILCRYKLTKCALSVLLVCSLFFYAYWNPPYIFLLIISILMNYAIQHTIYKTQLKIHGGGESSSRLFLSVGIVLNLTLIGYFKYVNFFADNIAPILGLSWNNKEIFLPLGISFFTFQQIACLVDTYRGKIGQISFCKYALFISFFPQLIAGPIVKYEEIVNQFEHAINNRMTREESFQFGLCLFGAGLFKKVVIADYFSPYVALVFDAYAVPNFSDALFAMLAYTLQIYFDFSGYSDMALGLGALFGVKLPQNFNSPYKATSVIDFWHRWHITLSNFLRDYLYIPLGGNRNGVYRRYVNLMITMLLGGLWHGAGWTFIAWGGLHGVYLVVNNLWKNTPHHFHLPLIINWLITFTAISTAWIFFRSASIERSSKIILAFCPAKNFITYPSLIPLKELRLFVPVMLISILICVAMPTSTEILRQLEKRSSHVMALCGGIIFASALWFMTYTKRISEFLYFQF